MREMSVEMAALLKSKKMVGENRPTHEISLQDGNHIIIDRFVAKCLRGADDQFAPNVDGSNFYEEVKGGGDFVTRADGKILLTYMVNDKVMLSVLDNEEEILFKHNQGSLYEWPFYTMKSYSTSSGGTTSSFYNWGRLQKLSNGKILLFIMEHGDVYASDMPTEIYCYESANGLGTDFVYKGLVFSHDLVQYQSGGFYDSPTYLGIGKAIELPSGRILIPLNAYGFATSGGGYTYCKAVNYCAYSDNGGLIWNNSQMQDTPWHRGSYIVKGFGMFESGGTRQIIAIVNYDNGDLYQRYVISNDDGQTWDIPQFNPAVESTSGTIRGSGGIFYHNGYNYLLGWVYGNAFLHTVVRRKSSELIPTNGTERYNSSLWDSELFPEPFGDSNLILVFLSSGRGYLVGTSHNVSGSISRVTGMDIKSLELKLQAKYISINRTNGMSSSLNIEFDNKDGLLAPDKAGEYEHILWPNKDIIVKQGYGTELIQTYKGLIDSIDMETFPQSINVSARDNLKRALDQTVSTILGEHVLTFVSMKVEDIFVSLANMAGIQLGVVEESGIAVAEKTFSWESYGDAFSWLSELVGFEVTCDEEGLTHFRKQQIPIEPTISYEFTEGEDIISLGYTINDTDLYRDIIVHGKKTVIIDEKEVDEVIEFKKVFSASDYWKLLPQKILKIDAPEATTLSECEQIALKAEYLMISRARVVRFQSIGIPHLQVGDFIRVTESSTTISEVYRITDYSTSQDSNTYTMDITCHWYSAEGVIL